MYVPYLRETVPLSIAFAEFSSADDAQLCILACDRQVAREITPTVIRDLFFDWGYAFAYWSVHIARLICGLTSVLY